MKSKNNILWRERFADQKESGLCVKDWCERNEVTKHAYYYWHRKLHDVSPGLTESTFVEVTVAEQTKVPKKILTNTNHEILIHWKDFSIAANNVESIPFLAELMQKLNKEC